MRNKLSKHFLSVFGIFLLAFAVLMISMTMGANKRCTEAATGTVVGYREDYDSQERSTSYFPIVEYTADRKRVEAAASSGSNKTPYEVGSLVDIRYNPEDVSEFVFEGDNSTLKWCIYICIVAVGCFVVDYLSSKGIINLPQSTHYHHHDHYGSGVSIDLTGIAQTVKMAKTVKGALGELKNMTPEERKAFYDAVNSNPEQYVDIQNEEDEEK